MASPPRPGDASPPRFARARSNSIMHKTIALMISQVLNVERGLLISTYALLVAMTCISAIAGCINE